LAWLLDNGIAFINFHNGRTFIRATELRGEIGK
jgi:hypothetical protein